MMVRSGVLLLRTAAKTELVAAMAWLTTPALPGVVGPPVGGFIVTYLDWRWTFNNIPIGILAFLVSMFIEMSANRRAARSTRGLLLSGVASRRDVRSAGRGILPTP